jgi:serine/threonine-protein kinase
MELKSGEPLSYYCEAGHENELKLDQKLEIFFKICDAIEYAHTNHVLHLDLKPENIQIGQHGEVLVCDWGLSSFSKRGDNHHLDPSMEVLDNFTLNGEVCGTPGYMSPEQFLEERECDETTDVFALGCLLYRMIEAKDLIPGSTLEDKIEHTKNIKKLVEEERISFSNTPQSIAAIIKKSIAEPSSQRYLSVHDLKKDLKRYTNGFSTLAEGQNFNRDTYLFYCRNRTWINIMILCFVVVFLSTSLFVFQLQNKKNEVEKLLKLNQLEKEWSEEFITDNINAIKESVYQLTDDLVFDDPEKSFAKSLAYLNRMISGQPNFKWGYAQRAYVYFLMQEFKLAHEDYEASVNGSPFYKSLCEKYARKTRSSQVLSLEYMASLFEELSDRNQKHLAVIICLYDSIKRNSIDEHSKVVELLLKCYNKNWQGALEYLPEQKQLQIYGKHCEELYVDTNEFNLIGKSKHNKKISLIKSLPIQSLILGNQKIGNFKPLEVLNLKSIDLSRAKVENFYKIPDLSTLESLYLSNDQMGIVRNAYPELLVKLNCEIRKL